MSYEKALKYIYSRELFGIKLGLSNISSMMRSLGSPQNRFRSIHVAGTNGKGSVCAFISSILMKQGYKVGLYTSPHLVDFRERIMVNGKKIGKKDVECLLKKVKPLARSHTFFEVVTAMAFLYFARQKVDFAVVEVGMGGRLDATNVITPVVSVITSLSLEHTEHLGDTIEKIAFEKAGIIKKGVPVVSSELGKGLNVIRKRCKEEGSRLYLAKPKKIKTSLSGSFQHKNVSAALEAVKVLKMQGIKIGKNAVKKGINSARWPGRMEFITKNLLFDCAHNPDGAGTLAKELKKLGKKDIYLVIGIMKDKDIKSMCRQLEPIAKEIIITRPAIARAAMPEMIAGFISRRKKVSVVGNVKDSVEYARMKAGKKGIAVVAGSIFTVGEAFSFIRPEPFYSPVDERRVCNSKHGF